MTKIKSKAYIDDDDDDEDEKPPVKKKPMTKAPTKKSQKVSFFSFISFDSKFQSNQSDSNKFIIIDN